MMHGRHKVRGEWKRGEVKARASYMSIHALAEFSYLAPKSESLSKSLQQGY